MLMSIWEERMIFTYAILGMIVLVVITNKLWDKCDGGIGPVLCLVITIGVYPFFVLGSLTRFSAIYDITVYTENGQIEETYTNCYNIESDSFTFIGESGEYIVNYTGKTIEKKETEKVYFD